MLWVILASSAVQVVCFLWAGSTFDRDRRAMQEEYMVLQTEAAATKEGPYEPPQS